MQFDIFVHATFLESVPILHPHNSLFTERIFREMRNSFNSPERLPIRIRGLKEDSIDQYFRDEHSFDSYSEDGDKLPLIYGFVHPRDWERFSLLIDTVEYDSIKIHGTFRRICAAQLALQLIGYKETGHNIHKPCQEDSDKTKDHIDYQMDFEMLGTFLKYPIKFGVVLEDPEYKCMAKILDYFSNWFFERKYGKIHQQLTDNATEIFKTRTK